ncbi:17646_t:CDS:2, partial [Racocetra fulgida]
YDVEKEYTISPDDLEDEEFNKLRQEVNRLIKASEHYVDKVLLKGWKNLECYDERKTVEEISRTCDTKINKMILLLTNSIYGNIINGHLEIPKLLIFAQLLFENELDFPTDITEDDYDKFKKKVNKIFKDSHWDTDIALINLEKTGSHSIAIPLGQQIAKNQVIIN